MTTTANDINLKEHTEELAFHPIKHNLLDKRYQDLKRMFWHHGEIDFAKDRSDWNTLDIPTQEFIKNILFLFAQLDGLVNENLVENFKKKTSFIKEARHFYAMQEANETIHNETYSILIETFILDPIERARGLDAIKHYPAIRAIADWAWKWMDPSREICEQLVAFVCIEGIIFQNPFAGIYYIRRRNKLPGLTLSNEWIQRDETNHTLYGMDLKHILETDYGYERLTQARVYEIIDDAVRVSTEFTRSALKVDLVGLSLDDMIGYTKCTADTILEYMKYDKLYNVENPLKWMSVISLMNKSNFFEKKVTEYARGSDGNIDWDNLVNIRF